MRWALILFASMISYIFADQEDNVVYCPSGPDMIKELKGFDLNYTYPCMYSGFVEVEHETDSNLFYWFFRHENGDRKAPLVLWINGGPGSSSMLGNLLENGPLKLVKNDETGDIAVHSLKGQAWSAVSNIVFVDQPIGVGYSYGQRNITEGKQIGEYIIKFIKGFYAKYPDLKENSFYISGESYGGKYLPGMASSIIDYNKNATDVDKIPLKGVLIGNGFTDPITQRLSARQIALGIGQVQFDSLPEIDTVEKRCHLSNSRKDKDAAETWGKVLDFLTEMAGGMNTYDARYPKSNSTIGKDILVNYLNDPEVVSQLHWIKSTKETKFAASNETVYNNFVNDGMVRYIDEHQKILDNNLTLSIFIGQFDMRDGPYGIQEWMKSLKWSEIDKFHESSRNLYYYVSDDKGEIKLGGNFKQHKNLSLLVIYAAGHLVPSTQLALSRNMLADIIYNNTLLWHQKDGKWSLDEKTWNLMKNWTQHGKWVQGKWKWDSGYFGGDCSVSPSSLSSASFVLNSTTWRYFKASESDNFKIGISSSNKTIIYTRKDDVPSQSFYDAYFSGTELQLYLNLNSTGEYIAVFNPSLDTPISKN